MSSIHRYHSYWPDHVALRPTSLPLPSSTSKSLACIVLWLNSWLRDMSMLCLMSSIVNIVHVFTIIHRSCLHVHLDWCYLIWLQLGMYDKSVVPHVIDCRDLTCINHAPWYKCITVLHRCRIYQFRTIIEQQTSCIPIWFMQTRPTFLHYSCSCSCACILPPRC